MTPQELDKRLADAANVQHKIVVSQMDVRHTESGWVATVLHPRGISISIECGHGLAGFQDAVHEAHRRWVVARDVACICGVAKAYREARALSRRETTQIAEVV